MSFTLKPGLKIVLAAVITAGAGTAAYAVYAVNADHQTVTVPDFSGKAQRIVEIWAKKNNLTDQIKFEEEYSDDVLTDCVISQSARKLSSNGTLTITLSQGPDPDQEVQLPDFSGKKKDEIEAWFASNDFSRVTYTYTDSQVLDDDVFVSMDPSAGTKIKRSSAVTVTLAKHAESTASPETEQDNSSLQAADTAQNNTNNSYSNYSRSDTGRRYYNDSDASDIDDGSGQSTNTQDDTDDHGSNDSQTPAAQETPEPVPTIVPEPTPAQPSQLPEPTTDSQAQVSGE